MKKHLLATTAMVAAGIFASQGALAEAGPIQIKVGGFHEQWVGFIAQDADTDVSGAPEQYATDLDTQADTEIHFTGSTTLDNGLTFGVNVQLESETSADQIDESYLFMRGSFGELLLGSENGAAYAMHYGADNDMGYSLEDGDTGYYWFTGGTSATLHSSRMVTIDNDSNKIRWISPRFEGFQIGLGYAPEGRQDTDGRVPNEVANDGLGGAYEGIFSGAVNYRQDFDGVNVGLSASGIFVSDNNDIGLQAGDRAAGLSQDDVWGVALGLRVSSGGFTGTLGYNHQNGQQPLYTNTPAGYVAPLTESIDVIAAGLSYEDGPMGVSLTGAYAWTEAANTGDPTRDRDIKQLVLQLGAKYVLGPGVEARGTATYAQSEDALGQGQDYTGFGVVGGLVLKF
jgi:predicted porin